MENFLTLISCSPPRFIQQLSPEFLTGHKEYTCEVCRESFSTNRGLEIHSNKIHSNTPKDSICEVCSKGFKNCYLLTAHKKQVHQRTERLDCPKCGNSFSNKSTLQKHMKKKHLPAVSIN